MFWQNMQPVPPDPDMVISGGVNMVAVAAAAALLE